MVYIEITSNMPETSAHQSPQRQLRQNREGEDRRENNIDLAYPFKRNVIRF